MPERRMAVVAVAFAIGVALADRFALAGCVMIIFAVLFAALLFTLRQHRTIVLIVAFALLGGALRYGADRTIAYDDISAFGPCVSAFEGRVASDTNSNSGSVRMTFRVDRAKVSGKWQKASGNVMLSLYSDKESTLPRPAYGDRARILVRPYIPFEPTNPGQFSWKGYLARHGIYSCASVRNSEQIRVLHRSRAHSVVGAALAAKHYLVSAIFKIHPSREASVISGIVLGTYAYLDEDSMRNFTRTGTLHVLAASGYNCFVLLMISAPIFRLLRVYPKYRSLLTILLILGYLLMVGPMPSLVRAAVMSSLMLLAVPLRRVADYANLFYVAGMVLLILDPSNLFDVGFQLSFLAVWALITVAPLIEAIMARTNLHDLHAKTPWKRRTHWFPRAVRGSWNWSLGVFASTLVGTVAVGLVTAPLVAYYFNYVSLTSLPANLAVAFLVPLVFLDSAISAVVALVPHASILGIVGTASTRIMLNVVGYLGSMRYSSVAVQSPGALGIVGYFIVLFAAAGYVRPRVVQR